MKNLPINSDSFGFVRREKYKGRTLKYKCGRDFLYYTLNYYNPLEFNKVLNNPKEIEIKGIFGLTVPTALAWTMFQFNKVPRLLKKHELTLQINDRKIETFFGFIRAMIFSRISYDKAIRLVENNIDNGSVVGVDVALRFQGLEDHIMFVYGYDEDNLYIFDTNKIPKLEYEKITDDEKFIMKLPRNVVKNRWKRFSRVWEVFKSK